MPQDIQSEILQALSELDDSSSRLSAGSDVSDAADIGEHEISQQLTLSTSLMSVRDNPEQPMMSPRPAPAVAPPRSDSRVIFSMGFDHALVSRALRCSTPSPTSLSQARHSLDSLPHLQRLPR